MESRKKDRMADKRQYKLVKLLGVSFSALIFVLSFYGCNSQPQAPRVPATQQQAVKSPVNQPLLAQPAAEEQKISEEHEGYVYERRDRRDPFVPLIVPKKRPQKGDAKVGTLESYDISEFSLAAIAKKDGQYFALLTTPDNRSFTVTKGTVIGLNKGKVKEIREDSVILVEYSRDYRGELKPREVILEFLKGEVE